uniref:Uncharacterized protein n=1 Tax=Oncorhynchus tshawytscha TaxID=74940 RepID=A0A8C8LV82_ONCTS
MLLSDSHTCPLVSTAKVGKTSLIMSLVSEEFPDDVPLRTSSCIKKYQRLVGYHFNPVLSS